MPYFSIAIPTRNRPALLKLALNSILLQKFQDYEVIVSDNSDAEFSMKVESLVKSFRDNRFKYIKPDHFLPMHDNWEFGLKAATGEYQGILIDKTMLRRNALEKVYTVTQNSKIEIVNYGNEGVEYFQDNKIFKYRRVRREPKPSTVEMYDPKAELSRRLSFETSIYEEGKYYTRGKICFGFYHRDLIRRVIDSVGRLFHPFSCDYSSCALALFYAENAVNINEALMYSLNSHPGNGYRCITVPGELKKFLQLSDPELKCLMQLPAPQLYSALHNFCAHDYLIINRLQAGDVEINVSNLYQKCYADLDIFPFKNQTEKEEQIQILEAASGISWAAVRASIVENKIIQDQHETVIKTKNFKQLMKNLLKTYLEYMPCWFILCTGSLYAYPYVTYRKFKRFLE